MAFGWAIIGAGMHPDLKLAPAITEAAGGELVSIYSRDRGRAEAFAEKHGASAAHDNLEDLLSDSRVDGVFVASPNSLHAQQTIQAAAAGKHVLAEKPMATSLDDALSMVRACRQHGVTLGTGFELRFHPAHIQTRRQIADGLLGRISMAQAQWARGERGGKPTPASNRAKGMVGTARDYWRRLHSHGLGSSRH